MPDPIIPRTELKWNSIGEKKTAHVRVEKQSKSNRLLDWYNEV